MARQKKRADGRYCKNVTIGRNEDGSYKRKMVYADTQKELELKVAELKLNVENGTLVDDENMTVEIWANKWLETYKNNIATNSIKNYKTTIKNHIAPEIGHIKLKDLREKHVQQLVNKKSESGLTRGTDYIVMTMKQMLKKAVKNGYIAKNVAEDIEKPKYDKQTKKPLTEHEIDIIKKTAQTHRGGPFILTLLYTGMRRGEIVPLTWNDIDFRNRVIKVNKAVEFVHGRPNIKSTKTYTSVRNIPMLDIVYDTLKEIKKSTNSLYVFTSTFNEIHTQNSLKNLFNGFKNECTKIAGYEFEFTLHQLRHTCATMLYNAGVGAKDTQDWMGHSTIAITMDIYTHLDKQNKVAALDKMNKHVNTMQKEAL
ncbi:MAG TPA: hypothetical protein DC000_00105 [Clostridiales bacterium]|nr:hypothetical protein [Clostridiales bacterium]